MFFALIASIAVTLAGMVHLSADAAVEARQPVRVISDSYSIDFPDGITLTLQAESDAPITEVTLFYRIGRDNPAVYAYPSFEGTTSVTIRHTIRTGGASYIPGGADVEYHFVLQDAERNVLETERRTVEYKDPDYDWQSYQPGDLVVLYHDRPAASVAEAAAVVSERAREVKALLGLESIGHQKAVILNGPLEAHQAFPTISDTATEGHLFGGFAFGDYDLFLLSGLGTDGMIHEMTHLLIDEALSSPLAVIPAWLNEGLAMHFESSPHGRQTAVLDAARKGQLLPVSAMRAVPGRPDDVRLFYAQSWSLVDYMMRTYGPDRMAMLLDAVEQGKRIDDAVRAAYGMGLADLERQWKASLAGDASDQLPYDPGTLGTSALIGGAVATTVVILVFRWLQRLINPTGAGESGPQGPG